MVAFIKNSLMFLGSGRGLFFIWIIIYTIYVVKKKGKYIYLLWVLFPIIPLVHLFMEKKSKTTLIILVLIIIFHVFFTYQIEPNVANRQILKVELKIEDRIYSLDRKDGIHLITNIKWDIYKNELLNNLGIKRKPNDIVGELKYFIDIGHVVKRNYPSDNIISILKMSNNI